MQTNKLSEFSIISKLGEGSFGVVYKVKRKCDGEVYALKKIKVMHMKEKDRINALNQIRILASYQGQHIIGYKESFFDQQSSSLCVILQYAAQGDVLQKIHKFAKTGKKITQKQIWKALVELCKALRSLHNNKILHRDLKSANVFIMEDGTYKLGDLNVSKVLKYDLTKTQVGTPYYASPQLWKDRPYGIKSDMWSLGCVLYEMAAQRPPFVAHDINGLSRKIQQGQFQKIPPQYSEQLFNIIKLLLNQNPSQRPTPEDLLRCPKIQAQYDGKISFSQNEQPNLLNTIKMSRNWNLVNRNLPKPQYDSEKEIKQEFSEDHKGIRNRQQDPQSVRPKKKSVDEIASENRKLSNYIMEMNQKREQRGQNHSRSVKKESEEKKINKVKSQKKIPSVEKPRVISFRLVNASPKVNLQKCPSSQNQELPNEHRKASKKYTPPLPSPLQCNKCNIPPPKPISCNRKHIIFNRNNSEKSIHSRDSHNSRQQSAKRESIRKEKLKQNKGGVIFRY